MALGPHWLRERRFWRPSADRDVDDELAFHVAMRAEIYEAAGLDRQAARDAALERFGDLADVRSHCLTISHEREQRMRRHEIWNGLRVHVRHALRRLANAPGFAAAVILMLALGIGATTTVFGVLDTVLLRPLPFPQPERLVSLTHSIAVSGITKVDQSDASYLLYARHATVFDGIAAWRTRSVNLGAPGAGAVTTERAAATGVTATLFPTLRIAPAVGRAFRPDDDRVGAPGVVVISSALWHRMFGGDPSAVGRQLVVDGTPREVVGVMPADFRFPDAATLLWYPLQFDPAQANAGSFNFQGIGRLRDGVTADMARDDLDRFLPRLLEEFPSGIPPEMFAQAHLHPIVRPMRDAVVGDVGPLLWMLLGAVALLLLVACANVASLFLVRAEGAQRELAIRMALGAGRRAVIAQYLGEALLLSAAGGALGLALAAIGIRALRLSPNAADLPRLAEVSIDARIVLFTLLVTTACAVAIGLLPVLRARHVAPSIALKESSRSATAGRERQRARSMLVVAQVALALVLVAGSALMARSFARLRDVEPGFDPTGVLSVRVALPYANYDDAAALRFFDRLIAAARALPGVRDAAVTGSLALAGDHDDTVIEVEDHPLPPGAIPADHLVVSVTNGYFTTMGVPLLTGRTYERGDERGAVREVLVSRSFARRYWKGGEALGRRIRPGLGGPWHTIVGIVGDVRMTSLEQPAEELVYLPIAKPDTGVRDVPHVATIVVRTAGDPAALAPALRGLVHSMDAGLPTYDERPMSTVLDAAAGRSRFILLMLGLASLVALAIGTVGLYGVIAYGVTMRRREIGVRIALGASVRDVTRLIARQGIMLAAVGVGVGLVGALAATRFLHGLLYDVSPTDPLALAGTCAVLLAVAAVASWLPARTAAGVDPMEALRRD